MVTHGRKIRKVNKMKYRDENGKFISKEAWETMRKEEDNNGRLILIGMIASLVVLYIINNVGRFN